LFVLLQHVASGLLDLNRSFDARLLVRTKLRFQSLQVLLAACARSSLIVADAGKVAGFLLFRQYRGLNI
jgi:hypothetical protein